MEITQEKIDLISKIIKSNRKFSDNEDLYDDFLNETCQRSMSIINAIDNDATLESYLRKVVNTSIINVLKDSGRLRRSKDGYLSTNEISLDTAMPEEMIVEAPEPEPVSAVDYSAYNINYGAVDIPFTPEANALHNEIINFVADTLEQINEQEPEKKFLDLFLMRYDKCLTQRQMAQELGISQSEVSKRIYVLLEKVKSMLDEQ